MAVRKQESERLKEVIYRWVDLTALSITAVVVCVVLQAALGGVATGFAELLLDYHWVVSVVAALVVTTGFWFILGKLGGVCFQSIWSKETACNPPVWCFGILSFIGYCLLHSYLFKYDLSEKSAVTFEAIGLSLSIFGVGSVFAYVIDGVFSKCQAGTIKTKRVAGSDVQASNVKEIVEDPAKLIEWIQKEEPVVSPHEDRFDMGIFARRIARVLQSKPVKTVGLVGPYGCGKTSILHMLDHYVSKPDCCYNGKRVGDSGDEYPPERIITCWVSGWGFREGTAAEHVLQGAIKELGKHTDCLSITTLPARYGRAIGDSGNVLPKIVGAMLCGWQSSLDILKKLDAVLARTDRRMVIFLEDIDRNKRADIFFNEISALLDGLKGLENLTFVLAIGEELKGQEVLVKTCEHIETIPILPRTDVFRLLRTFRESCVNKYNDDVDCLSKKEREEHMRFDRSQHSDMFAEIDELMKGTIDYVGALFISPRILKVAMRGTWQAWQNLHGEVDFDDLLVRNVLRAAAPEALMFINENTNKLRSLQSDQQSDHTRERTEKNRQELYKEFKRRAEDAEWDVEAASNLIGFLFPGWFEKRWGRPIKPPQGVSVGEPTDYWNRMAKEEVPSDEIRDQEVMHALKEWRENNEAKIYDGFNLATAIFEVTGFADKVEQFGMLVDASEVRCLAGELFKLILGEGKKIVEADRYFGFAQLWRLSLDKPVDSHNNEKWVLEEIKKALPVSLRFANDVYYYWRHQERTSSSANVQTLGLRYRVVEAAKQIYGNNPDLLIEALDADFMYCVHHFAKLFSNPEQGGTGFQPEDWKWLGEVLLSAAIKSPNVMVPQIIALVVDSGSTVKEGKCVYTSKFNEDVARKLFGEDGLGQLLRLVAKPVETSKFNDEGRAMIECARRYATDSISENIEQETHE